MPTQITVGDLRKELAPQKPQAIHPGLNDEDLLPRFKLGFDAKNAKPASAISKLDFKQIITMPVSNPFLLQRHIERGILSPETLKHLTTQLQAGPKVAALQRVEDESGKVHDIAELANLKPVAIPPEVQLLTPRVFSAEKPLALAKLAAAAPMAGTAGRPFVVDWRTRWGINWLTAVQSQQGENCWCMAATALVETMVRIEHCAWSKRSEGDPHDGLGSQPSDGGLFDTALQWVEKNGITDPADYPFQCHLPYTQPADHAGRSVRIVSTHAIGSEDDAKDWLDLVGPFCLAFDCYDDFFGYPNGFTNNVYVKKDTINGKPNNKEGGHAVLCVGYDDNLKAWICKNSWGSGFGLSGYFYLGYGQVNSDAWGKTGLQYANPDPRTKRNLHAGSMFESGNGAMHRNFELFLPKGGTVQQWYRDGSDFTWHFVHDIGNDVGIYQINAIPSTWNRNFEVVYQTKGGGLHHWAFDQASQKWLDLGVFGPGDAAGMPSLIQGNFGMPANLELVICTASGQIEHCWKTGGVWKQGVRFAANVAATGTLIQAGKPDDARSIYTGTPPTAGHLELVCTLKSGQLQHWFRDDEHNFAWNWRSTFGAGVGPVSAKVIQSRFSSTDETVPGHFELFVVASGQLQHWAWDSVKGGAWQFVEQFGSQLWNVIAAVQGSFGFDFELVVMRMDRAIQHFWSDANGWHEGPVICSI
jgi:Papain family cysteine protease